MTDKTYHKLGFNEPQLAARASFINGKLYMLDKAVKWLTNAKQYINPQDEGAADAFIEAFKAEMEKQ